ncbi:hypothetical protein G3576_21650 [Roseomonas stagni]|uniref:Uncharacterized protein n=2 Tax=Falsiroseomonas algicola TaxID=2716930 RepID=A0A6M1LRF0_9PROT|nr:hypothetical protein [Falsiroseomonas algicola]
MQRVWRLRHYKVAEDADERIDPRVMMQFFELGTFTSRELAEAAVQRLVLQPGFRDYPGGFRLFEYVVDRDVYPEGYDADTPHR